MSDGNLTMSVITCRCHSCKISVSYDKLIRKSIFWNLLSYLGIPQGFRGQISKEIICRACVDRICKFHEEDDVWWQSCEMPLEVLDGI